MKFLQFLVGLTFPFVVAEAFVTTPPSAAVSTITTQQSLPPHQLFYLDNKVESSLVSLQASLTGNGDKEDDENNPSPSFQFNAGYAVTWLILVAIAFSDSIAPGQLGSPEDAAMLQQIIANPVHPDGVNELFYTVFNIFGPLPLILASLILPQSSSRNALPAGPFVAASAAIGYFAIGPYMALRARPRESIRSMDEVGWFTKNVTENKFVAWFLVAFCLYLPFGANLPGAWQHDPAGTWQGFTDLLSSSRFAAVSCLDLFLLYVTSIFLTVTDYKLRCQDDIDSANRVALASALVPFLGSAIYLALRPKLPVMMLDGDD